MQKLLRWTSLALFTLLALFFIWFGITYASVRDMLWFHEAAVPEAARDGVRPLYLALMNLIGGASAALGLLSLYLIALPLRRGTPGAATALLVANTIPLVMAAITAEELAAATGSPTSWHIMGVLMASNALAWACHIGGRPRPAANALS
jgi:hypothetical protein